MELNQIFDLIGYIASFIILVSLTMKSILKLRWINAFGSFLFVIFAFFIGSTPTMVMNIGIIVIDLYFVYKLTKNKADYHLIKAEKESAYLSFFYKNHQDEIETIFGSEALSLADSCSYFVCNGEVAGLFAWKDVNQTECHILIDFVTTRFRDTKIGQFFFNKQLALFKEKGYVKLLTKSTGKAHKKYLATIDFTEIEPGVFEKDLQ